MRPAHRTLTAFLAVAIPLAAQQGAVAYKNLRHSPPGQYQQELHGFIDGQPSGPPTTQTNCVESPTVARAAATIDMANRAAAVQSCTMHLIHDEADLAETEQVCNRGPAQQVIHTTIHVIDDKTQKVETVSTLGSHKITAISTVRYLGPCTAEQKAENARAMAATPGMPAMPSLSREQCTELASSKREMTDAIKGCDDAPADQRPTCVATMKAAAGRLDRILAGCPR